MTDFVICRDKREKKGYWTFSFANKICQPTHLITGDYTLKGLEDILAVERKRNVAEIHSNLLSKREKDRFYREMERMSTMKYAYMLLEFSEADLARYPFNLPPKIRRKIRVRGKFLAKLLNEIQETYGVKIIFCGSRQGAIEQARKIFNEVHQSEVADI